MRCVHCDNEREDKVLVLPAEPGVGEFLGFVRITGQIGVHAVCLEDWLRQHVPPVVNCGWGHVLTGATRYSPALSRMLTRLHEADPDIAAPWTRAIAIPRLGQSGWESVRFTVARWPVTVEGACGSVIVVADADDHLLGVYYHGRIALLGWRRLGLDVTPELQFAQSLRRLGALTPPPTPPTPRPWWQFWRRRHDS